MVRRGTLGYWQKWRHSNAEHERKMRIAREKRLTDRIEKLESRLRIRRKSTERGKT